ncbi:MAG: hypothetical protein H6741_03040 [Alphaproteobacteria bacterium]|nr:hypothetical protein [Alphaproteobacteria bacterium]
MGDENIWLRLDGKTGERRVPLFGPFAEDAARILANGGAPQAKLFKREPQTVRGRHKPWMLKACEAAEVPYFTPHGLRRMAGNLLRRSGVHGVTYEALMGHSEAEARASYHDVQRWELAEAIRQVEVREEGKVLYLTRTA